MNKPYFEWDIGHSAGSAMADEKIKKQEYQKYEFCDTIDCPGMRNGKCQVKQEDCIRTAKEFHHWLDKNGFKIVKAEY